MIWSYKNIFGKHAALKSPKSGYFLMSFDQEYDEAYQASFITETIHGKGSLKCGG